MKLRTAPLFLLPLAALLALFFLLNREGTIGPAPARPSGGAGSVSPAVPPPLPDSNPPSPEEQAPAPEDEPATGTALPPPANGRVTGSAIVEGAADSGGIAIRIARYEDPGDSPDLPVWFESETASDGSFSVAGLPPGRYGLAARPAELPMKRVDFEVPPGGDPDPVRIVWPLGGTLEITVEGASGEPAKGVYVRIARSVIVSERKDEQGNVVATTSTSRPERFGKTDERGRLRLTNLPPGQLTVEVSSFAGGRTQELLQSVTVVEGQTLPVRFGAGGRLTGLLRGPDGKVLAGAVIKTLDLDPAAGYRSRRTETDQNGRYEFPDLPDGDYLLRVQCTRGEVHYVTPAGRVSIRGGETKSLDVRIPDTRLSGRITWKDTGEPVGRREVQITSQGGDGPGGMAFLDEKGDYAFIGLVPGAWTIRVDPLGDAFDPVTREVVLPDAGRLEHVDFALPRAK